jgi:hypothetical protein
MNNLYSVLIICGIMFILGIIILAAPNATAVIGGIMIAIGSIIIIVAGVYYFYTKDKVEGGYEYSDSSDMYRYSDSSD